MTREWDQRQLPQSKASANRTLFQRQALQSEQNGANETSRSHNESHFQTDLTTVPVREEQLAKNRTGMPDQLKAGLENLSGFDLSDVRVHRNSEKPAQLNAYAYAQGQDIHLGSGREEHLPHEGWHVIQQMQGRVKPTVQFKGVAVNVDSTLESEADRMGMKATSAPKKDISLTQTEKKNGSRGAKNTKQLYKVADDHIRADLRHKRSHKLFLEHTLEDIEERLGGEISSAFSNQQIQSAVKECRDEKKMAYNILSTQQLSSEKQITAFLEKEPDAEHMYVLDNDKHHVAIRREDVKLPHPTLVGGDPDVDCAGTMRMNHDGMVIVDDSSGHFKPGGAKPAQKKLNKIMNKTTKKGFRKKIRRGKR